MIVFSVLNNSLNSISTSMIIFPSGDGGNIISPKRKTDQGVTTGGRVLTIYLDLFIFTT